MVDRTLWEAIYLAIRPRLTFQEQCHQGSVQTVEYSASFHTAVHTVGKWINGSIEIVNRTIKRLLRVMILENELDIQEWPHLLPSVQYVINGTPSARLGKHAPREVC